MLLIKLSICAAKSEITLSPITYCAQYSIPGGTEISIKRINTSFYKIRPQDREEFLKQDTKSTNHKKIDKFTYFRIKFFFCSSKDTIVRAKSQAE